MNKEQFETIRKENAEKMSVTKDNLGEKSVDFLNMFARNFDFYVDEYKLYQDMRTKKERLYSEYYKKYRYDNKLEIRTTGEIESFIHTEELYYKLCLNVNQQELVENTSRAYVIPSRNYHTISRT